MLLVNFLGAHILYSCISLTSFLMHFCSMWAGVCPQEAAALPAFTSSLLCSEGSVWAQGPHVHNTSPAAACADVLTTGLPGPNSWHHCNAPTVVPEI